MDLPLHVDYAQTLRIAALPPRLGYVELRYQAVEPSAL